jgi:hypothetical protein
MKGILPCMSPSSAALGPRLYQSLFVSESKPCVLTVQTALLLLLLMDSFSSCQSVCARCVLGSGEFNYEPDMVIVSHGAKTNRQLSYSSRRAKARTSTGVQEQTEQGKSLRGRAVKGKTWRMSTSSLF